MDSKRNKLIIIAMIIGVSLRFIHAIPNFSPVVGLTIFGAALFSKRYLAFIIPFVCIYFSDFLLNNTVARPFFPDHTGVVWFSDYMIWTFASYALIATLSLLSLKSLSFKKVLGVTLSSSVIFFLVTNFGAWVSPTSIYPKDISGLVASYTYAIPFFRTSLISDLIFSGILFGLYFLAERIVLNKTVTV
jgi:hypothetical protein